MNFISSAIDGDWLMLLVLTREYDLFYSALTANSIVHAVAWCGRKDAACWVPE
jgi:hypothetical protein